MSDIEGLGEMGAKQTSRRQGGKLEEEMGRPACQREDVVIEADCFQEEKMMRCRKCGDLSRVTQLSCTHNGDVFASIPAP